MALTIRADIEIGTPGSCPVASASAETDSTVGDVTRSSGRDDAGRVVEEFTVRTESAGEESTSPPDSIGESTRIFAYENGSVYRFDRDSGVACACERIEAFGWPVSDVRAVDGALHVTCYISDTNSLKTLLDDLRDAFDDVNIRGLRRTGGDGCVAYERIDVAQLTDRQRDVLETAYDMGYFEYPRTANAGAVADELGITRSTFTEHLAAAQRKLLTSLLE